MSIWKPDLEGKQGSRAAALVEAIGEDIAAGRLAPGERLPPQRELASALGLSPNTVMRAYGEAVNRGYVAGEVGRGTYVLPPAPGLSAAPVGTAAPPEVRPAPAPARPADDGPIDFSLNLPFVGEAAEVLRQSLADLAAEGDCAAFASHRGPQSRGRHEDAGAEWIRSLGPAASRESVVIANGAQQGIFAALLALLRPGDVLLTEALTYAPVKTIARHLGARIEPVAIDREGILPDALEAACAATAAKVLFLTPTLQTPTAATLSEERRLEIARIAEARDLLIVEDDVFGFLPEKRRRPLAFYAPSRTVFVTSLAKVVAPGLRIGYVHAPAAHLPAIRSAVALSSWMPPPLMAEIASRLILDGSAARLGVRQRAHARRRQAMARAILGNREFQADPHGLHLWLPLAGSWSDDAFAAAARRDGVLVQAARTFAASRGFSPAAVRLCLCHEAADERVARGLEIVARLLGQPPETEDELVP